MNLNRTKQNAVLVTLLSTAIAVSAAFPPVAVGQTSDAAQPAIAKRIGAIKAISGNTITLAPDSGPQITVTVQDNARLLRMAPGDKDLKNAAPIQLTDLQVGDTVRVRGKASDDGKSIVGLEVIVITRAALDAVSTQLRQDWQKRGLGAVVCAVDPGTGTVTASATGCRAAKTIAIHTTKATVVRRYSPDSVKFEDAKPSTLQEIHVGDQARARGNRSVDGSELAAEEIVTGTFPYVEGTVKSVDASAGTLSVQDVLSKKTVQVKITADSQLHKIPAEMAQRFAMRLKSALPPGTPGAGAGTGSSGAASSSPSTPAAGNGHSAQGGTAPGGTDPGGASGAPGTGGGMRPGGGFDFQQLLSRLPSSTLADLNLQKGDAVVILATEGSPSTASTAITLLSGVEPILQAVPNASQIMMLTPWSLGGAPGGDAATQ